MPTLGDRLIILPPKGRIVLAPSDDTTPDVPRVILPEDPRQPPVFVPSPVTLPVTTVFPVVDIYSQLRELQENLPTPALVNKTSQTFHWEGPDPIPQMDDEQTIWYLKGLNEQHISRDWDTSAGIQRGSGIMYHEAIAQSGKTIIMRGAELVLWHSNSDEGNKYSRGVLVVCSKVTPPTPAQQVAIRQRAAAFRAGGRAGAPMYPHSKWTSTECPGDTIRSIVASL